MQEMELTPAPVGPMIPVRFETKELPKPAPVGDIGTGFGGGICAFDIFGAGHQDLIAMGAGERMRSRHGGTWAMDPSRRYPETKQVWTRAERERPAQSAISIMTACPIWLWLWRAA